MMMRVPSSYELMMALLLLLMRIRNFEVRGEECNPCEGLTTGFIQMPGTGCGTFVQCNSGSIAQTFFCQSGLIFDKSLNQCNWESSVTCGPDKACPTPMPVSQPTLRPTLRPTSSPSTPPPTAIEETYEPTHESTSLGSEDTTPSSPSSQLLPVPPAQPGTSSSILSSPPVMTLDGTPPLPMRGSSLLPPKLEHYNAVWAHLSANKIGIANHLLSMAQRTHNIAGNNVDKDELRNYAFMDFIRALRSMAEEGYAVPVAVGEDDNGRPLLARNVFYLGDAESENGAAVGLINVAVFLSQALADSIAIGSCDETNKDPVNGYLPISNSCGQYGFSYQDMHCAEDEWFIECPVDEYMQTNANPHGGVTPFYCGHTDTYPFTGTADYISGRESAEYPIQNRNGRTDVKGCCWWGRGVIATRGICQYGKLNYYLGARAAKDGRPARYSDIDFCTTPQRICSTNQQDREIEWVTGLFRWIDAVQSYDAPGWNYLQKLRQFVVEGMTDGLFIHGVSGIVTQGCHDAPCGGLASTGAEVRDAAERWAYFQQVAEALGLPVKNTSRNR